MAMTLRKCLASSGVFSIFKNPASVALCFLSNHLKVNFSSARSQEQEILHDYSELEDEMSKKVFAKINNQIANESHGRLFAVVQLQGSQFKITTNDIIIVRHNFGPSFGDKIRLEKVLLIGSSDFTLIGRPLLPLDQVSVIATVIEKTISHTIPHLTYKPRKNNTKQSLLKDELTYLRINSIQLLGKVNELGDTDGLKGRLF